MKKIFALLSFAFLTALSSQATVLFQDSLNYPYTDGSIEGQGQWYCYYPVNAASQRLCDQQCFAFDCQFDQRLRCGTHQWLGPNPRHNYLCQFFHQCQPVADPTAAISASFKTITTPMIAAMFSLLQLARSCREPTGWPSPILTLHYAVLSPAGVFPLGSCHGHNLQCRYRIRFRYITLRLAGATLLINPSYQDYQNICTC